MPRIDHRGRYLMLIPSFALVVLLAMLGSGPLSSNALVLLLLSALLLLGTAIVWTRREGLTTPIPIVALGLLVYFPLRGIVLLTSGLTNDQGINQRVIEALATHAAFLASVDVLLVAVVFLLTCETVWRFGWARQGSPPAEKTASQDTALTGWATALLLVGLVGVILQVPAGLGFLRGDETSGGLYWYLIYLAGFGFSLGIILSGRANGRLPSMVWVLLATVGVLAFYMGSKDTLFQPLLALLFAGAGVAKVRSSKARLVIAGLVVGLLVFFVFPAVTTYRNEIFAGQTFTQALKGVPAELTSKTIITGVPRSGGPAGYVEDSLLYMTNRLSGFDSLVLTTHAQQDSQILSPQTILLSPLGLVIPSGYWSASVAQPGHYFGQQYWGSVPTNNVSIAITIFGEVQLAFGMVAVPLTAATLAIITCLAARQFRSRSRAGRAFGFVLMVTALGFEHDVLYLLITTERRLVLLGIVVGLAAVGWRRPTPPPWRVAESAPGQQLV